MGIDHAAGVNSACLLVLRQVDVVHLVDDVVWAGRLDACVDHLPLDDRGERRVLVRVRVRVRLGLGSELGLGLRLGLRLALTLSLNPNLHRQLREALHNREARGARVVQCRLQL